jgi:dUTP pyrophosphatase
MKIQIKLLSSEAKIPTHGSDFAAGYDLYTNDEKTLQPLERHAYKTGVSFAMPNGVYGRIAPRSGLAFKNGVDVMAGVIDSDYRGELGVVIINLGQEPWTPAKGKPIAQIIFENHNAVSFEQLETLPESVRTEGGFGHTDTKPFVDVPVPKSMTLKEASEMADLVNKWKQTEDHPTPKHYEDVIRAREKTIQPK